MVSESTQGKGIGAGMIRIKFYRFGKVFNGVVIIAFFQIDLATIEVGIGIYWILLYQFS